MRPAHFAATMQAAGWTLVRIGSKGHHIYQHPSGASLTVDADNAHNTARYLARYARRDRRRATGDHQAG